MIYSDYSLQTLNTFGVDANARYFSQVSSMLDLYELINDSNTSIPDKLVIGEGSNILLTQNYPGLIIHNKIKGIRVAKEDEHHVWLSIGAGENWHEFVMYCVDNGYAGAENLTLIPGSIGAAPIQNIGAYGVEIKDILESVTAIDLSTGDSLTFNNSDCKFSYRYSIFKSQEYKNKLCVVNVTLRLNKKPSFQLDYGNITHMMESMKVEEVSIKAVSDAITKIRQQKLPDPKKLGNAGSFFKNPIVEDSIFEKIALDYPDAPNYPLSNNKTKIPAAWLIESCEFKGKRFNNIGVHHKQPLVLVNFSETNGKRIHELAQHIQEAVDKRFGVYLEPEVNIL